MSTEHGTSHAHPVPLKYLLGVWAILIILTWATVSVAGLHLKGSLGIFAAMGIAAVKSVFVALIFMHLLWDKAVNSLILVSSLLIVFLFIGLLLLDTNAYHSELIPGYAPTVTGTDPLSAAAADPGAGLTGIARGEYLFTSTCVVCHGKNAEGNQQLNAPALHHQSAWYLAAQLTKFRAGQRGTQPEDITGAQMRPMALSLPDDQAVQDVAEYISSLQAPKPPLTFDGDVAAGKALFNTLCVACHGADGMGNPTLQSPALVGQHDWYMLTQLGHFRKDLRGYSTQDLTGMQMKAMASTIPSDDMVKNVVSYVARMGR
jgi:cbb3-type cytochrome c oxidase subunit III